jgi:hypothetical protein
MLAFLSNSCFNNSKITSAIWRLMNGEMVDMEMMRNLNDEKTAILPHPAVTIWRQIQQHV